jgi:hypothetical protein
MRHLKKYEAFMIDIDVNVRKIEDSEECTGEEGCTCVVVMIKIVIEQLTLIKKLQMECQRLVLHHHILMEFHLKSTML